MTGARMASELPRWEGETSEAYVRRLAIYLGHLAPDAPEPGKEMPPGRRRDEKPFLERLEEIWNPREEPGQEG